MGSQRIGYDWTTSLNVKTSRGVFFLPLSDVCVRSFLYLFYTLIKLYYTKALSHQASSLALNWILLLQRLRIPVSFVVQQQPFITLCEIDDKSKFDVWNRLLKPSALVQLRDRGWGGMWEVCLGWVQACTAMADSCQSFYHPRWLALCQFYLKMHVVGEGPGASLRVLRHSLFLISNLPVAI